MDKLDTTRLEQLKKEKDIVILAHYYVDGDVQKIADYVGDSFYLSKVATQVKQNTILFCGVSFMGETAKILNPKKQVIMADEFADCPMAHMVDVDKINQVRDEYEDVAVVCYVNSTAEIKTYSDVCVTSSNAIKVVKSLKEKNIFFIPDENLGRYVAECIPEKNFIFNDGFCHVHKSITAENVMKAKEVNPDALVLTHPECTKDVLELSDNRLCNSQ
jgi:quinolinate synthase